MQNKKQNAFALVELIVVIVILAILATIAFLSFSSQSSSARDSTRLADMSSISKGLSVFNAASGVYPKPDKSVTIFSGTTIIGYQGEAGSQVLSMIKLSTGGKDPLKGTYYTYSTNASFKKIQELGFLENVFTSFMPQLSDLAKAGTSYSSVYPYSKGDQMGVIISQTGTSTLTYTPLQETSFTGMDITDSSKTSGFYAYKKNSQAATAAGSDLIISYTSTGIISDASPRSCKEILQSKPGSLSGTYMIKPDSNSAEIKVYCDMSTDGGGWTNIGANFGSLQGIYGTGLSVTNNGNSDNKADFPYVDIFTNTCSTPNYGYSLNPQIKTLLGASEIKVESESFVSSGDVRCGGAFAAIWGGDISVVTKFSVFDDLYLGTCDNTWRTTSYGSGYGFSAFKQELVLHYKMPYPIGSDKFFSNYAACSASNGTVRNKLISVMLR